MANVNEQKRVGNWTVRLEFTEGHCGAHVVLHTNSKFFDEIDINIYHVFESDARQQFQDLESPAHIQEMLIEGLDMEEHFIELQADLQHDWR